MEIELILVFVSFLILGILAMLRNKFYKYEPSDMLFATNFGMFLAGLLAAFVGIYGLVKVVLEIIEPR